MSYFRLVMIPVFCHLYLNAKYRTAAGALLLSSITDFLDGKVARRFHMVTDLGKALDPVADKLTHAAVAFCLATRYPLMWALIILMAVKEGYMAVVGILRLRKNQIEGAQMPGKVCTAELFVMLLVLVLFPELPLAAVNGLIVVSMCLMAATLVYYIQYHHKNAKTA